MKALVIDNEDFIRKGLVNNLRKFDILVSQVEEANGVEAGLAAIKKHTPDIVFLDVEMDDGTGFDLIKKIGPFDFQLVFITAFDKYAVNAFKLSAIDFLLKPIDIDDLENTLKKASESIKTKDIYSQLEILQNSMLELKSGNPKIVLKDNKSMYFVKINDIFNCEAEGSYTTFNLADNSKIVISKPLREYEALLEPFGFIRTHNSHLVNSQKIARLDKADGGMIILENGANIPVSQRKWDEVLRVLNK